MLSPTDLLHHLDTGELWSASARAGAWPSVADAYADALAVRRLRIERGERPVGYKIGFTNRTIWDRYRVFAPIWGTVWDSTLSRCEGSGRLDLHATAQPRLEPEIAFGLRATPPRDATLEQLFDGVEWIAPSFEIVQSHCPGWTFSAPETVADGALHARLLVGRPLAVRQLAPTAEALAALLAGTEVRLFHGDRLVETGRGSHVLDSPLHALHHFVLEQQSLPGAPTLQPGDVVTTGTWTDAWPVEAGQRWHSRFSGKLGGLEVELEHRRGDAASRPAEARER